MNKTALLNNRYQFISTLGRGGFGETFLATDTHLPSGKKCVIKQLKPIIQEPQIPQWMQDRFQEEARILERLGDQHSQIPRLYAYFAEGGNFYLVQEWIDGITLTHKVANEGPLPEKEVQKILVNILPVLDYVHRQRIVHRDLKPDNIILRHNDMMPVLIDFGAMKEAMTTVYTNHSSSSYSMAIGTPGYMSPEQAAGRPIYSSDLYSLALTAVYLLTGKSPQYLKTDSRSGELLWREAAPNLHSNLATVLDRTIRFHPGDRFSSAKEMLTALQQSTNSTSVTLTRNEKVSNNSPQTEFTEKKTIVVEPEPQEGQNFFKPLFLIVSLVIVALGSFAFGFKVLFNQNSPPEIANQPEEESFPPDTNNPPIAQKTTPQPQSQPQGETQSQPPEQVQSQPQGEIQSQPPEQVQSQPQGEIQSQPPEQVQGEIPSNQQEKSEEEKRAEELQREQEKRAEELQREQEKRAEELQREQEKQSATSINVPIIRTGTSESEIISKLGQPSSRSRGYWGDSTALLYRDAIPNQVDLGYLIENNTGKLRQTEVSFATSLDLGVMQNTLGGLLGGNVPPVVAEALRQVYQGETNLRSFNTGNFKGMIERTKPDRIYIGIWEPDFH